MEMLTILVLGVGGGIIWFLLREQKRKREVMTALAGAEGMNEERFVAALSSVSAPVATAVFRYFDRLGQGSGVNPSSNLFNVYCLDGNLLEECLDDLQSVLRIRDSGFAAAKVGAGEALWTVRDLAEFVEAALQSSKVDD